MNSEIKKELQLILKRLEKSDSEERHDAVSELAELDNIDVIPILIKIAETDPDEEVRDNAIYQLESFDNNIILDENILNDLIIILDCDSESLRYFAIKTISEMRITKNCDFLIKRLYNDIDSDEKDFIIESLSIYKDLSHTQINGLLLSSIHNSEEINEKIGLLIVRNIKKNNDLEMVVKLIYFLNSDNHIIRNFSSGILNNEYDYLEFFERNLIEHYMNMIDYGQRSDVQNVLINILESRDCESKIYITTLNILRIIGDSKSLDFLLNSLVNPIKNNDDLCNEISTNVMETIIAIGNKCGYAKNDSIRNFIEKNAFDIYQDPNIRSECFVVLGKFGDKNTAHRLIEVIEGDDDSEFKTESAHALADIGDMVAFEPLKETFNSKFYLSYIYAFARLGKTKALGTIKKLIKEYDSNVRETAIKALEYVKDRNITSFLTSYLYDSDEEVRCAIIGVLGLIGATSATELLIDLFEDSETPHRLKHYIIHSIGKIHNKKGIDFLRNQIFNEYEDVARISISYIGRYGLKKDVDLLLRVISEGNKDVMRCAVDAIGDLGDEKVLPVLINILEADYDDYYLFESIVKAMGKIGNTQALVPLINIYDEEKSDIIELTVDRLIVVLKKELFDFKSKNPDIDLNEIKELIHRGEMKTDYKALRIALNMFNDLSHKKKNQRNSLKEIDTLNKNILDLNTQLSRGLISSKAYERSLDYFENKLKQKQNQLKKNKSEK